MTTIETRHDAEAAIGDSRVVSFFTTAAAWVTTTDHKRIGRIYAGFGLVVLAATAVVGLVLGVERADDAALLDADSLLQVFQVYRVGLVFGGILPLALGLSVAIAPIQIGARSIAFPRLALTGCYVWLGGFSMAIAALIRNGGIGGGAAQAVDMFLVGIGLMLLGLVASAGCVAATILSSRCPGMTMRRVPLFAWSALVGSLGIVLALPVLFGLVILLFVDHRLGFAANFGGTEGLGNWMGWVFSIPTVAVFALPAVGVAAELIPVAFGKRHALRGVTFAGIALVGVAALAATTQQFVHDVTFDTDGQTFIEGAVPFVIFSVIPVLGLLVVFALGARTAIGGLQNSRPRISAGFAFAFLGLGMVFVGLLANIMYGVTDFDLIGSSVEEGATLYIVYGTALAVMGGLVFWAPKLWGVVVGDVLAVPLALLGVLGTVLAGLPLLIGGFVGLAGGVPATQLDVEALLSTSGVDGGSFWLLLSLAGHGMVALTIIGFAALMLSAFARRGHLADNPSGGHTIEWGTSSPAPPHNYEHVATVSSPEPQLEMSHEGSPS